MWRSHAMKHLVRAGRVAARHRDAGAPVASQQTVEVRRGLARDVAAAAEQLDVADAVRGQVPAEQDSNQLLCRALRWVTCPCEPSMA